MATKQTPARPLEPPAGIRPAQTRKAGQGAKYALVRSVLRTDPLAWIQRRRDPNFRHPDGRKGKMSFRELSEEITRRLRERGHDEFVTTESVARWCRPARKAS